jgi:hypothetical protein
MGHQEIVTSTTPWLGSAICEKPSYDRSTTRGYGESSRSSTVHVVVAPVASLRTVSTVPNGSVVLAHMPSGASEYQVASPFSLSVSTRTGVVVVVVVVGGGGGGSVVVVGGATVMCGATVVVVDDGAGGPSVVVVTAATVVGVVVAGTVVSGAWYAIRCEGSTTPSSVETERDP